MTTTHTVNLLLSNLPPEACLVHQLSSLVINLLSITILCKAGCKVFFHKTGCKVTLNGKTILRGWRDPKNCRWHVMIINDGWITNLAVHDVTRPIILLFTTPTRHLANSMSIMPSESNTTLANSLYECSNMGQLTNYYYACLNYPVKSTLTKAISRGYLKGWWGLTSQRTHHHISVSTDSQMGHMDQQRQGVQSTQPTPTTVPLQVPNIFYDPMEDVPQEPHNAHTHFVFMAIYEINGNLFTDQTGRFPITSNCGHAYAVVFYIFDANNPSPSKIGPKKTFFMQTVRSTSGSHYALSNLSYTHSTTKHQRMLKCLLPQSKLASSTIPQTSIVAQTLPNMPYTHGRITFLPGWQDYQNLSPSPTGVASQCNAMLHSTCYVHVFKFLSSWHMKRSRGCSLSMPHPWHHSAQRFSCT
jgi:hypothetical protein